MALVWGTDWPSGKVAYVGLIVVDGSAYSLIAMNLILNHAYVIHILLMSHHSPFCTSFRLLCYGGQESHGAQLCDPGKWPGVIFVAIHILVGLMMATPLNVMPTICGHLDQFVGGARARLLIFASI